MLMEDTSALHRYVGWLVTLSLYAQHFYWLAQRRGFQPNAAIALVAGLNW